MVIMTVERPRPIVEQVSQILRERISSGEYAPGARLPSESDLAAELGVSRATVRSVMAALEQSRLVTRRQGDGTYINRRVMEINARLGDEWDFSFMIRDSGRAPRIVPIAVERRTPLEEEAQALELAPKAMVLSVLRVYYADDRPVIYSRNTLPLTLFREAEPYDLSLPIRDVLRRYCGQEISYSFSDISAALPTPEVIAALERHDLAPLLKFTDTFYNERDHPLVFGSNYYDDKLLRLRVARPW
jgi:DNA-binding GntR family transcriptional regulator